MLRDLKVPFLTIAFALLSLFIFTKIFGPIPFSVTSITTNKSSFFSASGTGEATAVPNTAMISLGVNKEGATVEATQNEVNTIINLITKDLKSLGIGEKDIKTSNYSVSPQYDFSNGRQSPNGYQVNATLSVNLDSIEMANQAIDIATKDGATQVGSIQFILSEEDREKAESNARKEAIANAKTKAENLAKDTGIKLGKLVDVQESGSNGGPIPFERTAVALDAAEKAPTELSPGENKISVTITLSYETY